MRLSNLAAPMLAAAFALSSAQWTLADNYKLDDAHMSFYFKVNHMGFSETMGRFNKGEGTFTIDGDKSSFSISLDAASIDTGVEKRDDHLRGPDFFNVKQFPKLTFKSTSATATGDTLSVPGELTIHGVTKTVTFELRKIGQGPGPGGKNRIGFSTDHVIKRSDFGMDKMLPAVGDEITLMISFEGIQQ